MTFGRPADLDDVRRVAAAGALGVEGVDGAAGDGARWCPRRSPTRSACRCGSSPGRPWRRRRGGSSRWRRGWCPSPRAASARRRRRGPSPPARRAARRCPCRRCRCSSARASTACSMRPMCQGPGVQVVASVPCAGPVPPPSMVVMPECSASSICCGQMKWMWASKPPAVRIRPSPAMTSVPGPMTMVTPGWVSGLPALPIRGDAAVAEADVGLVDAGPVDDQRVGDDGVDGALGAGGLGLAHAVADHLAAAELHLLAVGGEVALDLDEELGVGEADPVAGGRAVHVGVGGAGEAGGHGRDLSSGWERTILPSWNASGTVLKSSIRFRSQIDGFRGRC